MVLPASLCERGTSIGSACGEATHDQPKHRIRELPRPTGLKVLQQCWMDLSSMFVEPHRSFVQLHAFGEGFHEA